MPQTYNVLKVYSAKGAKAMSNVIRFPGGRYLPPKATVALIDKLTTVEIELARARIAQIRSETQQANIYWTWYCCKKILFWGLVAWLLVTLMAPAKADTIRKTFYDRNGAFLGNSIERGNSGSYYDGAGRFSGSSLRVGNQTLYYDYQSRYSGSTINTGPRR
jgi:hypothetical protein